MDFFFVLRVPLAQFFIAMMASRVIPLLVECQDRVPQEEQVDIECSFVRHTGSAETQRLPKATAESVSNTEWTRDRRTMLDHRNSTHSQWGRPQKLLWIHKQIENGHKWIVYDRSPYEEATVSELAVPTTYPPSTTNKRKQPSKILNTHSDDKTGWLFGWRMWKWCQLHTLKHTTCHHDNHALNVQHIVWERANGNSKPTHHFPRSRYRTRMKI